MNIEALRKQLISAIDAGINPVPNPHITIDPGHRSMIARMVEINNDSERQIQKIIDESEELKIYDESMINLGNAATSMSRQMLTQWLLLNAKNNGPDEVIKYLTDYLKIDHNPATETLAISGIEIDGEIEVYPNCLLKPFSELPDSAPKESLDPEILKPEYLFKHGHFYLYESQRIYVSPKAALTTRIKLKPKFRPRESDLPHELHKSILPDLCDSLTLVAEAAPLPVGHWFDIDQRVPGTGLFGSAWNAPLHDVMNHTSSKLSVRDIEGKREIIKRYMNLPESVRKKLKVAIQRLGKARRHRNYVDKAIDLGVALESIYLGKDEKSEIAYTFRLRAAWHLGENLADRKKLISLFGCIYDMRSKAVHRGELKNEIKIPQEGKIGISTLIERTDQLCAKALTKIIMSGDFPDWKSIVLGQ